MKIIKKKTSRINTRELKKFSDFVLAALFPIYCLGCGREDYWLCHDCARELCLAEYEKCFGCGRQSRRGEFCNSCRASLDSLLGLYQYKGLAKALVKAAKYSFAYEVIEPVAELMIKNLRQMKIDYSRLRPSPVIVPVPLSGQRQCWRGFNQSYLLARHLSRVLGLSLNSDSLIRLKHTQPQAKLSRRLRLTNLRDAFACRANLSGQRILLIDDVATTGATLNECARVLKLSGADRVEALVFASGK